MSGNDAWIALGRGSANQRRDDWPAAPPSPERIPLTRDEALARRETNGRGTLPLSMSRGNGKASQGKGPKGAQ